MNPGFPRNVRNDPIRPCPAVEEMGVFSGRPVAVAFWMKEAI